MIVCLDSVMLDFVLRDAIPLARVPLDFVARDFIPPAWVPQPTGLCLPTLTAPFVT